MIIKIDGKNIKIPATPTYFKNGAYVPNASRLYLKKNHPSLVKAYDDFKKENDKILNRLLSKVKHI